MIDYLEEAMALTCISDLLYQDVLRDRVRGIKGCLHVSHAFERNSEIIPPKSITGGALAMMDFFDFLSVVKISRTVSVRKGVEAALFTSTVGSAGKISVMGMKTCF